MLTTNDDLEKVSTETSSETQPSHINKYLCVFAWLLGFALIIECFLWNNYYWTFDRETYPQREIQLPYNDKLKRNALIMFKGKEDTFIFENINQMVRSVQIEAYGGTYAVRGKILATSENYAFLPQKISNFFFAPGLNLELNSHTEEHQKALIKLDMIEPVLALYLSIDNHNFSSPLAITKVIINPDPKFKFSLTRMILMIFGFFLLYVLLFSKLYQHNMEVDGRLYKWLNRGIFILIILFSVGILLADHPKFTTNHIFKFSGVGNTIGSFPYNTPNHTLLQEIPKSQKELGELDLYIELADALFVKHQLHLDLMVDPELLKLNNIRDISERRKTNVEYYFDRAFYDGKYYCYYGLAPIVLIYAPIYYLTGLVPGAVFAAFLATIYALIGLHALSSRLTTLLCDRCNIALFVVSKVTLYMASFVPYLQSQIDYYRLPFITNIAALCLAFYFGLELLFRPKIKGNIQIAEHHLKDEQILQSIYSEQGKSTHPTCTYSVTQDPNTARRKDGSWSAELVQHEGKLTKAWNFFINVFKSNWQSRTSETLHFITDFKQMAAMLMCGICVVLVVMSRPLSLIYIIVGLGLVYLLYLFKVQQSIKAKIINSLCLIIPIILGAIVVSLYNYYRFGSIFEFGQMLQLTVDDVSYNHVRLNFEYLKTLFFQVLFSHLELSSDFPFVALNAHDIPNLGQYVLFDQRSGLLMYPYYWGLFLLPILLSVKRLSTRALHQLMPPLQHSLALRYLQLTVLLWYISFPIVIVLIGYNAGWNQRYISEVTCLATIIPFLLILLLHFNWQSQAQRILFITWICCCIYTSILLFFLTINNHVIDLGALNPRLYIALKDIFDPLAFN